VISLSQPSIQSSSISCNGRSFAHCISTRCKLRQFMTGTFYLTINIWGTFSTTTLVAVNSYSCLLCCAPPWRARRHFPMRRMKKHQSVTRASLCTVAVGHWKEQPSLCGIQLCKAFKRSYSRLVIHSPTKLHCTSVKRLAELCIVFRRV